jgi:exodeoxyribonuclease VII large subunit
MLEQRLDAAIRTQEQKRRNALDRVEAALAHLNPEATLARGFSIVRDTDGNLVTDAAFLRAGQTVSLYLAHGEAEASILASSAGHQAIAT